MIWLGILIGCLIGGMVGFVACAICVVGCDERR